MNRFGLFLKKHWIAVIICILVALFMVVGVPFIINLSFSCPAICNFFAVKWEAKDALAYYGSVLGVLGTIIFSGLALWQNHVIKTESDKHTKLLEKMENQKNMPILHFGATVSHGNCGRLGLYIENISENIATEVYISKIKILNKDGKEFWSNEKEQRIAYLQDRWDLSLMNPPLISLEQIFSFQISYQDKFGKLHTCNIEGKQMETTISFPRFFITEISEES